MAALPSRTKFAARFELRLMALSMIRSTAIDFYSVVPSFFLANEGTALVVSGQGRLAEESDSFT